MDAELIIYLIFVGILIISRFLKKSGNKPGQAPQQDTASEERRGPVKSFEELLEEFTSGRAVEEPEYEEGTTDYDQIHTPRETPGKQEPERPYRSWENTGTGDLRTIDELVDIDKVRTKTRIQSDDEEETEESPADLRDLLIDSDDARRAIILSEIIRRRY